jgi:shikimate kinase
MPAQGWVAIGIVLSAMSNQKILYMLIGPKGSGKTYIGTLVNLHTDIAFLRVEAVWLGLQAGEDGWKKVETVIDTMFQAHNKVMIESLGIGEGFRGFHVALAGKYPIKMIHVFADLDTCLTRVKKRNKIEHIAVSDDKVMEFNKIALKVIYDWDLEINNNHPASDADIINAIQSINDVGV